MITLLIGHRGTGKTTFLRRLEAHAREHGIEGVFLDLDAAIEAWSGQSIYDIFTRGERDFRRLERKVFEQLLAGPDTHKFIAVGAGFEGPPPREAKVLWLRRETDAEGRLFLGRPRLNPELSPLEEYKNRFQVREHRFRAWAHEQLFLPEGYAGGLEDFVLQPERLRVPYDFTLLPEHFRRWDGFREKRAGWGIRRFELRDDLLSLAQAERARSTLPKEKILSSVRRGKEVPAGQVDWPLELGPPPARVDILSRHEPGAFRGEASILKLAPEVKSFAQLAEGHAWWLNHPKGRAFLPRSSDGRWRWYRALFGPRMPLHYYREDEGSALDQPLLAQILLMPSFENHFAAVLGAPVSHSRSPEEHRAYFQIPFVAIDVAAEEFSGALKFLIQLGLSHAAVTAPLKRLAFEACDHRTPEAAATGSVNTLYIKRGSILGHNTDVLALKEIARDHEGETWLWGGGGVRASVREAFGEVTEFSARTGLARDGRSPRWAPKNLIWAAGRANEFIWPPDLALNARILDLNYAENSPGLEWALRHNLPYQSGLKMFKLQAEHQRHFWEGSR